MLKKPALLAIEERAIKYYLDTEIGRAYEAKEAIPRAWVMAINDVLNEYFLGVYPMTLEDIEKREASIPKEGRLNLNEAAQNIVKFEKARK